jgi:hypothetical protein
MRYCCSNDLHSAVDERWTEWLDSKLMLLIDPESVDPKEHGGKNVDE